MTRSAAGPAAQDFMQLLATLGEVAETLLGSAEAGGALREAVGALALTFGLDRAEAWLFDPEAQALVRVVPQAEAQWLPVTPGARRALMAGAGQPDPWEGSAAEGVFAALSDELPPDWGLTLKSGRHLVGLLIGWGGAALTLDVSDALTLAGRQLALALHAQRLTIGLKEANLQLGLKVRHLEQLFEVASGLSGSLEKSEIVSELTRRAAELLDARAAILALRDEESGELLLARAFQIEPERAERWLAGLDWLEGAIAEPEPSIVEPEALEPLGARHGLLAPVFVQSRPTGVLLALDKESREGVGDFGPDDAPLLMNLAEHAAVALSNAHLYELATVDALTKLFIRRHFEQRMGEELTRARRYNTRLSLAILDIDHFKRFNDTYGHATGDEVLKLVARTLKANIREEDIAGRFGGEEMLLLMPETDTLGAYVLAERIREAIAQASLPGPSGEPLSVTVSVGVATFPLHAPDAEALVAEADACLYRSKAAGRNRVTASGLGH